MYTPHMYITVEKNTKIFIFITPHMYTPHMYTRTHARITYHITHTHRQTQHGNLDGC